MFNMGNLARIGNVEDSGMTSQVGKRFFRCVLGFPKGTFTGKRPILGVPTRRAMERPLATVLLAGSVACLCKSTLPESPKGEIYLGGSFGAFLGSFFLWGGILKQFRVMQTNLYSSRPIWVTRTRRAGDLRKGIQGGDSVGKDAPNWLGTIR